VKGWFNILKADTHVHTSFSPDSLSPMIEYTKLVDRRIVEEIGFAEHVDFLPECGAYGFFDYKSYIYDITHFNEIGYKFHAGAEIDYASSIENEILEHLKVHHYEYTIASVHMLNGFSISDGRNIDKLREPEILKDIAEKYYKEVAKSLKVREFNVIAHIDIYARSLDATFFTNEATMKFIVEMQKDLAYECYKSGKIIEVNTSGVFAPYGQTLPGTDFLKMYYAAGGRKISIGSDAHCASHVLRGFEEVAQMLKMIGFDKYYLPWKPEESLEL